MTIDAQDDNILFLKILQLVIAQLARWSMQREHLFCFPQYSYSFLMKNTHIFDRRAIVDI